MRNLTLGKNSKIKIGGSADVTYKQSLKLGILYLNWGILQLCSVDFSSLKRFKSLYDEIHKTKKSIK